MAVLMGVVSSIGVIIITASPSCPAAARRGHRHVGINKPDAGCFKRAAPLINRTELRIATAGLETPRGIAILCYFCNRLIGSAFRESAYSGFSMVADQEARPVLWRRAPALQRSGASRPLAMAAAHLRSLNRGGKSILGLGRQACAASGTSSIRMPCWRSAHAEASRASCRSGRMRLTVRERGRVGSRSRRRSGRKRTDTERSFSRRAEPGNRCSLTYAPSCA
jgi:hypothetical protein